MSIRVLAAASHPDDIEFMMAGTMLRLKECGAELHMLNIANGNLGTTEYDIETIGRMRWEEAQDAARVLGATMWPPIVGDLEVFYTRELVARVCAVVRQVKPDVMLVSSPQDYMEDHINAQRLAVTAAFFRCMPNFTTIPDVPAWLDSQITVYHAQPYGLCDQLRKPVRAEYYVDIEPVLAQKRHALAQHRSQQRWLDESQGNQYLDEMESQAREMGRRSGRFTYAEGWRRHLHLGFCLPDTDPLGELLKGSVWIDPDYITA